MRDWSLFLPRIGNVFWISAQKLFNRFRMLSQTLNSFRAWTTIAVVIALSLVGYAHEDPASELPPGLSAFISAGGSWFDLCNTGEDESHRTASNCEACRIADTLLDLHPGRGSAIAVTQKTQAQQFVAKRLAQSRDLDPARLTRAPPLA